MSLVGFIVFPSDLSSFGVNYSIITSDMIKFWFISKLAGEKRFEDYKDSRGQVIVNALIQLPAVKQMTSTLEFFLPLFLDFFKNMFL